jgi:citrate synthase
MRKANKLIMGIGHRIKSLANPDKRVEIIKDFAQKNFQDNTVLKVSSQLIFAASWRLAISNSS